MTNGQMTFPLVIRSGNGGGLRFGAQHSQSVENWAMMVPGLKVVVPSNAADVIGLMAASIRDDDPVIFLEAKALYASRWKCPTARSSTRWARPRCCARAATRRSWRSALMVPRALAAAEELADDRHRLHGRRRALAGAPRHRDDPARGHGDRRLFTVEENPRLCGWGAEVASIVAEEIFYDLDGPIVRITTPHIPLPAADALEDMAMPSVERIVTTVTKSMNS